MMTSAELPIIQVTGDPYQRGHAYGEQAAALIRRSVAAYTDIFKHYVGWDWSEFLPRAKGYLPAIRAYRPHLVVEMEAMAEGAGLTLGDILTLNLRTEILNAAHARAAAQECTAFVAGPQVTRQGRTFIGQNWDWKPALAGSLILLVQRPQYHPSSVTLVEAGLLAKTGMNAAGIGLATNALITDRDLSEPHVPYHIILRAILESDSFHGALGALTAPSHAAAANYLIAHRDGRSRNLEAVPGQPTLLRQKPVQDVCFVHTNHFQAPSEDFKDISLALGTDSPIRQARMETLLEECASQVDLAGLQTAMGDHHNYPFSVCCHPDPNRPAPEQYASLASIVMDLTEARLWVAHGNPCQAEYREYNLKAWFASARS